MNYYQLTEPVHPKDNLDIKVKMYEWERNSYLAIERLNNSINEINSNFDAIRIAQINPDDLANKIVETICEHFNTSLEAIIKGGREQDCITAKFTIIHFLKKYTKLSLKQIAWYFVGKSKKPLHHSTILNSINRASDRIYTDKEYRRTIERIEHIFANA
jgi:chromosomal replication initiator protein